METEHKDRIAATAIRFMGLTA